MRLTILPILILGLFFSSSSIPMVGGESEKKIWIWSISELEQQYVNNECFLEAVKLASVIAQSEIGKDAFDKVSSVDNSLTLDYVNKLGKYPQLQVKSIEDKWAQYEGDMGVNENIIFLDKQRLDAQLQLCSNIDKKNDVLINLAAIILHETAHWSDNVIKHPNSFSDTPGEEGIQLERDIFGGTLSIGPLEDGKPTYNTQLLKNGHQVEITKIENWGNLDFWIST